MDVPDNSFPSPPQPPPTVITTPSALLSAAQQAVDHARSLHVNLTEEITGSTVSPSTLLSALAEAENALITASRLPDFYAVVDPSATIREAAEEAKGLFAAFKVETAMNEALFAVVDATLQDNRDAVLDRATRRWLEKVRQEHVANGLSLPAGPKRERFKAIKTRIEELESEFRGKLSEARSVSSGVWFSRDELDGMDEGVLGRFAVGKGENEGLLRATFGNSDYLAVLRSAKKAETRKKMFIAVENSMAAGLPLLQEAIMLRDEAARLLGFPSHAAFSTSDKMAKTPQHVDRFLSRLQNGLSGAVKDEIHRLKALKQDDVESRGETFDGRYFIWDHLFYHTISLKRDYDIDQQLIAEYFSYESVVSGMLAIFEQIMGFRFSEIERSGRVWHDDVQVYSVWNSDDLGGGFVGYLYLDLYPRHGKPNNPRSSNLVPGIPGQHPATVLICSFPKTDGNNPSLLQHNEIVLLFHELGHCIHDLACTTTYARLHGPEGTALDFSEAPSQLLEYWFWTPSVLKTIGRHYSYLTQEYFQTWREKAADGQQPPESLPDETINRLLATKHVNAAVPSLRQLAISVFDMEVHSSRSLEELATIDVSAIYNKMRRDMCGLEDFSDLGEGHSWGHGWAIYPHLMDGYDAGFYSYLFSKVYAADIFKAKFALDPMSVEQGRRFRRIVLEKGGMEDEMEMMAGFLGREPSMEAFCQELGIS